MRTKKVHVEKKKNKKKKKFPLKSVFEKIMKKGKEKYLSLVLKSIYVATKKRGVKYDECPQKL